MLEATAAEVDDLDATLGRMGEEDVLFSERETSVRSLIDLDKGSGRRTSGLRSQCTTRC